MLRYYLIATLIVLVAGSLVFAHRLARPDLRISAQPTGTPTVESPGLADRAATPRAFAASGSWILSALPACFEERSRIRGRRADLDVKIPAAMKRVPNGTTLRFGVCAVVVRQDELWVDRGADRLRVPNARLYRDDGMLVLVAKAGATAIEIRRYVPAVLR